MLVHELFSAHDIRPWLSYESVPISGLNINYKLRADILRS
jgi:hypothetical protein